MNAPLKVRTKARPARARARMVLSVVAIVGLLAASVAVNWPSQGPGFAIPPALDGSTITALPDNQLIERVTTDLRFTLASGENPAAWRNLPEPARNILALSWVDRDLPPKAPIAAFDGFAAVVGNHAPNAATFADIAAAYEAIGAPAVALVVREAAKIAATASGDQPFHAVDQRFRDQVRSAGTINLQRRYIRTHAAEIAAASQR